jgi:hypothetical protein
MYELSEKQLKIFTQWKLSEIQEHTKNSIKQKKIHDQNKISRKRRT